MLFGMQQNRIANVLVKHLYARHRLELDVFDNTDKVVFVLFDKPAIQLVKFSASSLMQLEHDVSMKHICYFT